MKMLCKADVPDTAVTGKLDSPIPDTAVTGKLDSDIPDTAVTGKLDIIRKLLIGYFVISFTAYVVYDHTSYF